jgi:hypothetical protein
LAEEDTRPRNRLYLDRESVEVTSSIFISEKNVVLLKTNRKTPSEINPPASRRDVAFPRAASQVISSGLLSFYEARTPEFSIVRQSCNGRCEPVG